MLGVGSYHVVVGNPPYITVEDEKENANYRAYPSCYRGYQLTVPFAEKFFLLARSGGRDRRGAGYVGQITSNAFMKREFGKKLIEVFFPKIDLTQVIDTSGAYIPGMVRPPRSSLAAAACPGLNLPIRAALGVRGEPKQPECPLRAMSGRRLSAKSTARELKANGSASWIFRETASRRHPWSLSGGGLATC